MSCDLIPYWYLLGSIALASLGFIGGLIIGAGYMREHYRQVMIAAAIGEIKNGPR